jgi:3-mercaptopyruvate sulfurtransferase SseA
VLGRTTFEAAHIPGADLLDLQGEFSDTQDLPVKTPDRGRFGGRYSVLRHLCARGG